MAGFVEFLFIVSLLLLTLTSALVCSGLLFTESPHVEVGLKKGWVLTIHLSDKENKPIF